MLDSPYQVVYKYNNFAGKGLCRPPVFVKVVVWFGQKMDGIAPIKKFTLRKKYSRSSI